MEHTHAQPSYPVHPSSATALQRLLSNRNACLLIGAGGLLLARFLLVHFVLIGGYPLETMIANVLASLVFGLLLGAVEGRMTATHQERQSVMGIPLTEFMERFRLPYITGCLLALCLGTFLEMGLSLSALSGPLVLSVLTAIGIALLGISLGLATLWFSFSWGRWCFGEISWN